MNEQIKFKALNFTEKQVGKIVRSSKKEYVWQFQINGKMCYLVLKISKFSGNYSIVLNKIEIHKGNILINNDVDFSFKIKQLNFDIYRKKDGYELAIEGTVFNNYYEDVNKRKSVFVKIENNVFQTKSNRKIRNTSTNINQNKPNIRSYSFNKILKNTNSKKDLFNVKEIKKKEMIQEEYEEESDCDDGFNSDVFNSKSQMEDSYSNELDRIYNVQKEYSDSTIQQPKKFTKDFMIYEDIEIQIEPITGEQQKQRYSRVMKAIYSDLNDNQQLINSWTLCLYIFLILFLNIRIIIIRIIRLIITIRTF